ncbi:uncharacterized protein LOC108112644 [Drosophila eugracilis]|uniref:uncharacterized protein LOC108112644 n=1 Tax=Drosophila eugracilis TaxID=29029 RepID=UPI0007E65861|nr:uncharacterized protein LOC108112644 [Drosophila eugracilis]
MRRTHHSVIVSATKYSDSEKQNFIDCLHDEEPEPKHIPAEVLDEILNEVLKHTHFPQKQSDSSLDQHCQSVREAKAEKQAKLKRQDDDLDMDPRLRNWNRVLEQRQRIQKRIERQTGKRAEDVLFNRSATIDEAGKRMILRILDTADRSRPLDRLKENVTMTSLKPRCDPNLCLEIKELFAVKPTLQEVEFIGLPEVTQKELASTQLAANEVESQFQRSEVLSQRLETKKRSIQRVLEFAPDLQQLQVTQTKMEPPAKGPPITKVSQSSLKDISDDSTFEEEEDLELDFLVSFKEGEGDTEVEKILKDVENQVETQDLDEPQDLNGLMVNGMFLDYRQPSGPTSKNIYLMLECDPYERKVKMLLDIQNLSPKFVHVFWLSKARLRSDRATVDAELVFDRSEFILEPRGRRIIQVMFQPQTVGIFTQRWHLCLRRTPLCGTRRLDVVIQGKCTMPAEFLRRLEGHKKVPLDKQQRLQAQSILNMQASLAPIIENPRPLCPYKRSLDDREVFNAQNYSYRCDRYEDLEILKGIYELAKKPRDRPWDLSIQALRNIIGKLESRFLREHLHNQLVKVLEPMKCNRCSNFPLLEHNPEQERSRFIYVRGTISSTIDAWETMAFGLDEQFFKLELLRYLSENPLPKEFGGLSQKNRQQDPFETSVNIEVVENISKRVKSSKYLKDSLYMQTYSLLCDAAEDIVSVIESTAE